MRVVLVGVDHQLQNPGQGFMAREYDPTPELRDKERFGTLLTEIAATHRVVVIAEEQLSPRPSIPRDIASALKIQHEYVDMPLLEREACGIPGDYSTDPNLSSELVQAFHSQREAHWVQRLEASARPDATCILVCGLAHLTGVAPKLAARGHSVEVVDVREIDGFDLTWLGRGAPGCVK
jgi:hypothetical protein